MAGFRFLFGSEAGTWGQAQRSWALIASALNSVMDTRSRNYYLRKLRLRAAKKLKNGSAAAAAQGLPEAVFWFLGNRVPV